MSTDKQVTLEDREAAAMFAENVLQGWCAVGGNDFAAMRNGFWDDDDTDLGQILQAFAAHRIQSTRQLQADLDEVLEALGWAADALEEHGEATLCTLLDEILRKHGRAT